MTEQKKTRGRASKYGKKNENTAAIALDLKAVAAGDDGVSMYYIQKLVALGLGEIRLTDKGNSLLANNA